MMSGRRSKSREREEALVFLSLCLKSSLEVAWNPAGAYQIVRSAIWEGSSNLTWGAVFSRYRQD